MRQDVSKAGRQNGNVARLVGLVNLPSEAIAERRESRGVVSGCCDGGEGVIYRHARNRPISNDLSMFAGFSPGCLLEN